MLRISTQLILLLLVFTIFVSSIALAESDSNNSIHPSYTDPSYTIFPLVHKQVQYNIPYKVINGVIEDIVLRCDINSMMIYVSSSNGSNEIEANLTIGIPRQTINAIFNNGEDDLFFIVINGSEVDYEEVKEFKKDHVRVLEIELTQFISSKPIEIEIIGPFITYAQDYCKIVNDPPYSIILPPLKQLKSVEDIQEIICREENHRLIFKEDTGNPACVRESTMQKLIERGWTSDHSPQHTDIMEGNKDKGYGMTEETLVTESNLEAERFKPNSDVIKDRGLEIEVEPLMESNEIKITGNTDKLSQDVTLTVTAPNGNVVSIAQISPSVNGDFTTKIMTGGRFWIMDGFYTVTAQQNEDSEYQHSLMVDIGCGVVLGSDTTSTKCFGR